MEPTMQDRNWATIDQFVSDYNRLRTAHKNEWIACRATVCGKHVKIKSYKLWIQVLTVDGVHHGNSYPAPTVTAFKRAIADAITYQAPAHLTGAIVNTQAVTW